MALPRLTGALRAFSSVTAGLSEDSDTGTEDLLRRSRASTQRQLCESLSWRALTNLILSSAPDWKEAFQQQLNRLMSTTCALGKHF